jgi:hypothetical protein
MLRSFLERFPGETTVRQLLDVLAIRDEWITGADIRCSHPNCGRLITDLRDGYWVHVAPDGKTNRSCKSASYDDPKPGDTDKREWLDWPRVILRQTARPPR